MPGVAYVLEVGARNAAGTSDLVESLRPFALPPPPAAAPTAPPAPAPTASVPRASVSSQTTTGGPAHGIDVTVTCTGTGGPCSGTVELSVARRDGSGFTHLVLASGSFHAPAGGSAVVVLRPTPAGLLVLPRSAGVVRWRATGTLRSAGIVPVSTPVYVEWPAG